MQLLTSFRLGFSLLALCLVTAAQTKPTNESGNATISGLVTLDGKAAHGVTIIALPDNYASSARASAMAKTNAEGRYRLMGLTAGNFKIFAAAREYVSSTNLNRSSVLPGHGVTLDAGEQYEAPEITLVRGGVITGRITDTAGNPLIEESIKLYRVNEGGQKTLHALPYVPAVKTDDRGVYRVYGLPAGRYLAAAGSEGNERERSSSNRQRRVFKLAYHTEPTDPAQAKVLEVTAGSEHTEINIKLGSSQRGQEVTVRVIDAATGQPVPDVNVGYGIVDRSNSVDGRGSSAEVTNSQGETKFVGVLPGRYVTFLTYDKKGMPSEFYAEPQPFEMGADDTTRIEIATRRGAQVSGIVKFEGITDPALLARAKALQVSLRRQSNEAPTWQAGQASRLAANFSFQLVGLSAGKWQFELANDNQVRGFVIARVEHNENVLGKELELDGKTSISGLQLVVTYNDARIKGQIQINGGTLPSNAVVRIAAFPEGSDGTRWGAQADARGQFVIDYLPAGAYVLRVSATVLTTEVAPNVTPLSFLSRQLASAKQSIVVGATGERQVNLTLDLSAKGRRQ